MGEETDRQEKPPILQYLGTVGNSASPRLSVFSPSHVAMTYFFFSLLKVQVGSNARGNEFVLQVELSQGGPGQTRSNIGHIFFLSCKG